MNRFGPTLRAARAGDWSCGFLSAGFGLGCASEVSLYLKDQGSYSRLGAELGLGLVRACDFVAVCYVPLYLAQGSKYLILIYSPSESTLVVLWYYRGLNTYLYYIYIYIFFLGGVSIIDYSIMGPKTQVQ